MKEQMTLVSAVKFILLECNKNLQDSYLTSLAIEPSITYCFGAVVGAESIDLSIIWNFLKAEALDFLLFIPCILFFISYILLNSFFFVDLFYHKSERFKIVTKC
jgi:hypothetical protein